MRFQFEPYFYNASVVNTPHPMPSFRLKFKFRFRYQI